MEITELFSNKKNSKTILFIGVFHGDEPMGELLINNFINNVKKKHYDIESFKNNFILIPVLNKWGKENNVRVNSNGVDLNRNFPTNNWKLTQKNIYYSGTSPGSETETKFMINTIEKYKPNCIVSLHQPYRCVNYDGVGDEVVKIAKKISDITGYELKSDIGYETLGSFGTYCGLERKIPTITLELSENDPFDKVWSETYKIFEYFAFDY